MKKRILPLLLAIALVLGAGGTAGAAVNASDYFAQYGVAISAPGEGQIMIEYDIDGVKLLNKVGVQSIKVERQLEDGSWTYYTTFHSYNHPEWYRTDAYGHTGIFYFDGTVGETYRVTLTVLAVDDNGSETKTVTSYGCTCR